MDKILGFTGKEDLLKFTSETNTKILNLCHIPEDGRLKSVSFSIINRDRINDILDFGERVDGSNLFSFIEPQESDIYIKPDVSRAFHDPFSTLPTLNVLCDYTDENGKPLDIAPKNILARAEEHLRVSTKMALKALTELEFYIIGRGQTDPLFPVMSDRNYHESPPFAKFHNLRNEVLATLDVLGVPTKYGHGEAGLIYDKSCLLMEQHEIELQFESLGRMADTIALAKWAVRNICARHGVSASFIPKIDLDHAGTGMHIHVCAFRQGKNVIPGSSGTLSKEALKIIGGILRFAPSLSAFANPTPISYLRLIAQKESPMHVCWGVRNRLALIRIPLWSSFKRADTNVENCLKGFEYRAPDAFANPYLLFAGILVAADYGLENPKESMEIADELNVEVLERKPRNDRLLPSSCDEAAMNLEKERRFYEAYGIFPKKLIDETINKLRTFKDKNLRRELTSNPRNIEKAMAQFIDYG